MTTTGPLKICGQPIHPGEQFSIRLPTPKLYTYTPIDIPVHIVNSKKPGPRLFVCAAIHGDEISGVEIIRRLLKLSAIKHLQCGTLIAVPIVNIYGFIYQSRYLPDRRDLNRNFPGSKTGSLTARLAQLFLDEVVANCSHGIDLHSGAIHRCNLPQVRGNMKQKGISQLAKAFAAPVILDANLRDGSLRQATNEMNIPLLVYEGGEALRLNERAIRIGLNGVLNVMRELNMIRRPAKAAKRVITAPMIARSSLWVRAPRSGMLQCYKSLGDRVSKQDVLGIIADPFGSEETQIVAPCAGIIIGHSTLPLNNEGEALFHIACGKKLRNKESLYDPTGQIDPSLVI